MFSGRPPWIIFLAGLVLLVIIGLVDYITGYELSFFIFYLIPITHAAWYGNKRMGYLFCVISVSTWFYVDHASGHRYSYSLIPFWNGTVRLTFFLLSAYWVSSIKTLLLVKSKLARIDGLTGCLNVTAFKEKCDMLFKLTNRVGFPISLGYIDVDNFKPINDLYGHSEGDRVLQAISITMMQAVRGSDIVGRMGGDEFSILLPNTGIDNARIVFDGLRNKLLECARVNNWSISFSIGVIIFPAQSGTPDKAIGLADALMYRVKNSGKNNILYEVFK
ncbi:MAG: GGDEF domain-containing protein [Gallionella sp.]